MAQGSKRGTYPLLTLTMFALVATGALTTVCRPFIPPPEPGAIATLPGAYMKAGAGLPIRWRSIADDPYAEARRLDLPVILVIGSASSEEARAYDQWVFRSPEVAVRMNQEFICVRIDLDERPEWAYQFLPISRAQATLDPSFQVWVTDAEGRLVNGLADAPRGKRFDPVVFLNLISSWQNEARAREITTATWQLQRDDEERLSQLQNQSSVEIGEYANELEKQLGEFGFVRQGMIRNNVLDLRFLLQVGDRDLFERGYRAMRGSMQVDWVHGGIFEEVEVFPRLRMSYDKRAESAAEWVALTALVARQTGSREDRWIAEWTFDRVWEEFVTKDGVAAWIHTESDALGRNLRIGITPRTQSFIRPSAESWGIEPGRLPTMSLRWQPTESPSEIAVREKFLTDQGEVEQEDDHEFGPTNLLGPTATFYARMLEAARVMNDPERARPILDEWPSMRRFRSGLSDVVRSPGAASPNQRALVDYVAYLDMALEVVSWSGEPAVLAEATQVAKGALQFAPEDGLPAAGRTNAQLPTALTPHAAPLDGPGESPLAGLIRTLNRLSLALPDGERESLQSRIRNWTGAVAYTLRGTTQRAAGFYRVAVRIQGVSGVLVVGESGPITPILGRFGSQVPVLAVQELKGASPGVYVFEGDRRTGPMSVEEAVNRVRGGPVAP
ncbi:MAG: DUF255 domain-containing protein [Fimbriimonadaceae bacterium]|nr:DUF255 domain-containing protein [Fimbriimonadaceae bacterium]